MRDLLMPVIILAAVLMCAGPAHAREGGCMTGAFLSDKPSAKDINAFKKDYGKKPAIVVIFINWGDLIDKKIIKEVYAQKSVLLVTLEPWDQTTKKGVDYDGLAAGKYDKYLLEIAGQVKKIGKPVLVRFAHEMNGNWYPWIGSALGRERYISMYRHVKDVFDRAGAANAVWVFSVNWEDVPPDPANNFKEYYPGDGYVDIIGIDGYNWGDTQTWAKWREFKELFTARAGECAAFGKPVMISEFGSTTSGGNRTEWVARAMDEIKNTDLAAFILFNVDKETDWRLKPDSGGRAFKEKMKDEHFTDTYRTPK